MGCPRLRGGRAAAFTRLDEALLSLKYDVSLGAAVSDASRVLSFLATLLDAWESLVEREESVG